VKRLGRWIDFENDYKTLDPSFMESVWCVADAIEIAIFRVCTLTKSWTPASWAACSACW
jgi:isoleucyl-tRNA synthetase